MLTPEQIAAAKARLDKARGVPPAGAGSGTAGQPAGRAARSAAGVPPQPPADTGRGPHAKPPTREPISITTWLLVAMILAVIWYLAKPANEQERIDKHVDKAIALMADCKLDAARAEVAAMRAAKATDLQLKKANEAISGAVKNCEMRRQRAKAWTDLTAALESALQSGAVERADARLSAFTRKWGPDDATRDWDKRIDIRKAERLLDEADACLKKSDSTCLETRLVAAEKLQRAEVADRIRSLREALSRLLESTVLEQKSPPALGNEPPRSVPQREVPRETPRETPRPAPPVISTAPQVSQAAAQARKILSDAERELNQGNYKSAMDKAEICATMIDVGNRECLGLKQRAERLNREMLRCVASGADWINDRCQ
ncbi:hypothetical protein LJR289_005696 [Pseudoduganella sp. LjRoot289]|uniref:hypothetical protein n=1 Tax=Pseudoduganella sp. LjRoot289 TaxID=3342314 RepID=UPI003ECE098D